MSLPLSLPLSFPSSCSSSVFGQKLSLILYPNNLGTEITDSYTLVAIQYCNMLVDIVHTCGYERACCLQYLQYTIRNLDFK